MSYKITIPSRKRCDKCNGKGKYIPCMDSGAGLDWPSPTEITCYACKGTGYIKVSKLGISKAIKRILKERGFI